MEEKNSAVELNNKLRQELAVPHWIFLLIMQTVNNSVTLDFMLHSPFIFLARQSYAIALLIAFAFLYISLSDYILVSFVTYVLQALSFLYIPSLSLVLFLVPFAFHDSIKCRTTCAGSHDPSIHLYKVYFYLNIIPS
jgi:fatty acid desaturase